jgi:hypothetical protein
MTMPELLSRFNAGEMIGLVAVSGGLLCGLVAIFMGIWHEHRKTEINAALKQEMLNRGMSADDIRTVLEAGTNASNKGCSTGHSSNV